MYSYIIDVYSTSPFNKKTHIAGFSQTFNDDILSYDVRMQVHVDDIRSFFTKELKEKFCLDINKVDFYKEIINNIIDQK